MQTAGRPPSSSKPRPNGPSRSTSLPSSRSDSQALPAPTTLKMNPSRPLLGSDQAALYGRRKSVCGAPTAS